MQVPFWNKEIETAERAVLEEIQIKRLRETIGWALKTPFYQKQFRQAKISSPDDIRTLDDLKKIPFTTKDDLRLNFPKGLLAVDMKDVVRIHSSSGTTGIPTVIYYSKEDIDNWADLMARCIFSTGVISADVLQLSLIHI